MYESAVVWNSCWEVRPVLPTKPIYSTLRELGSNFKYQQVWQVKTPGMANANPLISGSITHANHDTIRQGACSLPFRGLEQFSKPKQTIHLQ